MKINKIQRQNTVLEIIKRWGRVNKQQLDDRVSNSLKIELTEALKRAIYRDLEELVIQGTIELLYFTRDGAIIDDFDPEMHKNYYIEWISKDHNKRVFGQSLLSNNNSDIYVSDLLKNEVSISENNSNPKDSHFHAYFYLNSKLLTLSFSKEAIPLSIVISRFHEKIQQKEIDEIKSKIGSRFIIFKVSSNSISSYKKNEILGHTLINFLIDQQISIEDLKSKNGTNYYKLTPDEADSFRLQHKMLSEETVSISWDQIQTSNLSPKKLKQETGYCPFLLELGTSFRILIL